MSSSMRRGDLRDHGSCTDGSGEERWYTTNSRAKYRVAHAHNLAGPPLLLIVVLAVAGFDILVAAMRRACPGSISRAKAVLRSRNGDRSGLKAWELRAGVRRRSQTN